MHLLFPSASLEWTNRHDSPLEPTERASGGRGLGVEKTGGQRGAPGGVLPFVVLVEAFLFSFLPPFERRVKTK